MPENRNSWHSGPGLILACLLPFSCQAALAGVPNSGEKAQIPALAPAGQATRPGATKKLVGGVSATEHQTLDRGPLLFSKDKDFVIETPFGSVFVAAHSVVLFVCSENGLVVYNLHDSHGNAVIWKSGTQSVSLAPGRMLAEEKSLVQTFAEANPAPFVQYRGVSCHDTADRKLYQAEFNLASMISGFPALRKLIAEEGHTETHKTMNGLVKTTAILNSLTQGGETFGYYVTPRVRAISAAATATTQQQTH